MNERRSGFSDAATIAFVALLALGMAGFGLYALQRWVQDNWGSFGNAVLAFLGVAVVVVITTLVIVRFGAGLYRAGVRDAAIIHETTVREDTRATLAVVQAMRGELTHQARADARLAVIDGQTIQRAYETGLRMGQKQLPAPAPETMPTDAGADAQEVDAQYWEVRADQGAIRYDA